MQSIPVGATGSSASRHARKHLSRVVSRCWTLPPVPGAPVMDNGNGKTRRFNCDQAVSGAGESCVGTRVDVRHLASDAAVRTNQRRSESGTNVDGRRIEFSIRAIDEKTRRWMGTTSGWSLQLSRLSNGGGQIG